MTMTPHPNPFDPMAMFREVVNQWEKAANDYGSQLLARPETAAAMHKATAAGLQVQNVMTDAMSKMLSAANMPSKAEVEAIGQRLGAIEATLARIEAQLAGRGSTSADRPRPSRGRLPDTPA